MLWKLCCSDIALRIVRRFSSEVSTVVNKSSTPLALMTFCLNISTLNDHELVSTGTGVCGAFQACWYASVPWSRCACWIRMPGLRCLQQKLWLRLRKSNQSGACRFCLSFSSVSDSGEGLTVWRHQKYRYWPVVSWEDANLGLIWKSFVISRESLFGVIGNRCSVRKSGSDFECHVTFSRSQLNGASDFAAMKV